MEIEAANLDLLLAALAEQLALRNAGPIALVICGGAALSALGLVQRTTRDVDVRALGYDHVADEL